MKYSPHCIAWFCIGILALSPSCSSILPDSRGDYAQLFESGTLDPIGEEQIENRKDRVLTIEGEEYDETRLIGIEEFYVSQQGEYLCWAACAEMILRYDGEEASQEGLAQRIKGYTGHWEETGNNEKSFAAAYYDTLKALCPDAPASEFEVIWESLAEGIADDIQADPTALNDGKFEVNEIRIVEGCLARSSPQSDPPIFSLLDGHPAILGLYKARNREGVLIAKGAKPVGHAFLLVGATYEPPSKISIFLRKTGDFFGYRQASDRFNDGPKVITLHLIDPRAKDDPNTPENEMAYDLDYEAEKDDIDYIITRDDAMHIIRGFQGAVTLESK